MNDRCRVRTASAVGAGAAVMLMMSIIAAMVHVAAWAGQSYRARRAARHTHQKD
ncbi:hypothetical protein JYP51_02010 [Ponticoccus gilvus]|nr:hypothetical protein [Enemella evansiae]